jgi:rhodanese-related sulfurtransferase
MHHGAILRLRLKNIYMNLINVQKFHEVLLAEKDNTGIAFINVCTPVEYSSSRIEGVENMPLDELGERFQGLKDKSIVYIHCASGVRSKLAVDKLTELGIQADLVIVEGGLMSWINAGFKTIPGTNKVSLLRKLFGKKE